MEVTWLVGDFSLNCNSHTLESSNSSELPANGGRNEFYCSKERLHGKRHRKSIFSASRFQHYLKNFSKMNFGFSNIVLPLLSSTTEFLI